jgi:hypothetical protein
MHPMEIARLLPLDGRFNTYSRRRHSIYAGNEAALHDVQRNTTKETFGSKPGRPRRAYLYGHRPLIREPMGGPGNRIIEKARRLAFTTSLTICSTRYSFTSSPLPSLAHPRRGHMQEMATHRRRTTPFGELPCQVSPSSTFRCCSTTLTPSSACRT